MSTRLTNYTRERIAKEILIHRFSDHAETLRLDRAALAEEIYNDIYRKPDREKMAALPEGWLPADDSINVQFGDHRGYESLSFAGSFYGDLNRANKEAHERISRRVLNKHYRQCSKVYDTDHRLAVKWQALNERKAELEKQYREADKQVKAALDSATTVNRLVEMWPEVEPFVRKFDAAPLRVPSIPTGQLNKLLDLPVSEAA